MTGTPGGVTVRPNDDEHPPILDSRRLTEMASYTCDKCGMSVNMTCATCNQELVDDVLTKDDGSTVRVSKCQEGHGMIKSPMCCAQDMTCAI